MIRKEKNKGNNKLKTEYSTVTADRMNREEIIELCTE